MKWSESRLSIVTQSKLYWFTIFAIHKDQHQQDIGALLTISQMSENQRHL